MQYGSAASGAAIPPNRLQAPVNQAPVNQGLPPEIPSAAASRRSPQARAPQPRAPQPNAPQPKAPRMPSDRRPAQQPAAQVNSAQPLGDRLSGAPLQPSSPRRQKKRIPGLGCLQSWQFWTISATVAFVGAGGLAAALLFKLPAIPNCPETFWPTASASLRIYCAQLAANKQTVDDLLEGIALVNTLPSDHPLRPEVNRSIQQWSQDILKLAAETFNRGDLKGAIAIAQRIPINTTAYGEVAERVKRWQATWSEAEGIYQKAENALLEQDPRLAFDLAVQLLDVGNTYWETVKYQELTDLITASREDGNKLAKIRRLGKRGGLRNLLSAVAMAQEIKPNSPVFPAAQRLINSLGKDMLALADDEMRQRDLAGALAIIEKIPASARLQSEIQDFSTLSQARAATWNGSASDIETAIGQAQRIRRDRPLYGKAQELISYWQVELQDLEVLSRAQQIAELGTLDDLRAAIAEASQVPRRNPRGDDARSLISRWTRDIQTSEDRPILIQAEQIAIPGDLDSLQSAIAIARRISSGRSLHAEAQEQIRAWNRQVQQLQAPLAGAEIPGAGAEIASPSSTRSNPPSLANPSVSRFPSEITLAPSQQAAQQANDQATLAEAYNTANTGTPSMLVSAIQMANQISFSSPLRSEADRLIDFWSQQVLQIAQQTAPSDVATAIALAKTIPSQTGAYAQAQLLIEQWQQQ